MILNCRAFETFGTTWFRQVDPDSHTINIVRYEGLKPIIKDWLDEHNIEVKEVTLREHSVIKSRECTFDIPEDVYFLETGLWNINLTPDEEILFKLTFSEFVLDNDSLIS